MTRLWRFYGDFGAQADPVIASNAAFDLRFINREMRLSRPARAHQPVYYTMKGYRALELGGSASLSAVAATSSSLVLAICTARSRTPGSRFYLWPHGCPLQGRLRGSLPRTPSNFRHAEIGPYRVDR